MNEKYLDKLEYFLEIYGLFVYLFLIVIPIFIIATLFYVFYNEDFSLISFFLTALMFGMALIIDKFRLLRKKTKNKKQIITIKKYILEYTIMEIAVIDKIIMYRIISTKIEKNQPILTEIENIINKNMIYFNSHQNLIDAKVIPYTILKYNVDNMRFTNYVVPYIDCPIDDWLDYAYRVMDIVKWCKTKYYNDETNQIAYDLLLKLDEIIIENHAKVTSGLKLSVT